MSSTSDKRVLVLARYAFPFHVWLETDPPLGALVMLTPPENVALFDTVSRRAYTELIGIEAYESSGTVELTALRLHEKYDFTHVVCQAEQDIIRAARLREHMGLEGQSLESALSFRDKVIMKDHVGAAGLRVPAYARLDSAMTLITFLEDHGYPAVVKPVTGMGSISTTILRTPEDTEALLAKGLTGSVDGPIDLEVEEFIEGEMYHIDGCIIDGETRIMWPSKYINTCVGFDAGGFLASYTLEAGNPLVDRLNDFVQAVLDALNAPPSYSFHVEVWHTATDDLVLCEAACRTGGAGVQQATAHLTLCNLDKVYVQAQCGVELTSPLPPAGEKLVPEVTAGWIVAYPQLGRLTAVEPVCPLPFVLDYGAAAKAGDTFSSIAHCTDALASFLIAGEKEADVIASITKAMEWLRETTEWELPV